jgi:putative hemolysin
MAEETIEITPDFINVRRIVRAKNPRLLKIIPGFFFTLLEKIIHQETINRVIYTHRDKFGLEFVKAVLDEFGVNVKVSGRSENLPLHGRFILVSNHPLGGLDGLALMHEIGKVRKDVVFPVNDLLLFVPGLKSLFIPINKTGKNNENVAIIDQTFASEKAVLYFPAGLVSRKQKHGIIKDLEWKKTFVTRSKKYHRDIIPVYIKGKNSGFFYNFANLRKRLGIKVNLEMLLLPHEMMRQRNQTIEITFGKPFSWTRFDKSHSDPEWAEIIREEVYTLAKE